MNYLNDSEWNYDDKYQIMIQKDVIVDTAFSGTSQEFLMTIEDDSWWFSYRANVIISRMEGLFSKDALTLDVGGGNGYTSYMAQKKGYHIGVIEPSIRACINAKKRGIHEVNCGTVSEESIADGSLRQVLLLDVLEHIEDDAGFIDLLQKKITQGGLILITVPAFMCLWSGEDDVAGHFRRYRIRELCKLLEGHGFNTCYSSYFMSFLFVPILVVRGILVRIGISRSNQELDENEHESVLKSQFKARTGIIGFALSFFEAIEVRFMRKGVPFGSSIIVVAKKVHGDSRYERS